MTGFSNNLYDRRMERLMMTVPNFVPRGVGFRFTEAKKTCVLYFNLALFFLIFLERAWVVLR